MQKKTMFIVVGLFLIYVFMLKYMLEVILPFILAIICFFILKPIIDYLEKIFHIKKSAIGISLLLIIYLLIIVIIISLIIIGTVYLLQLIECLPIYYSDLFIPFMDQVILWVKNEIPFLMAPDNLSFIQDLMGSSLVSIASSLTTFMSRIPSFIFSSFIFIISTFFLFLEYEDIKNKLLSYCSFSFLSAFMKIKDSCIQAILIYLKCQFVLMSLSFLLLWIAFFVQRSHHSFLYAMLIALLDSLPFIGVGIVLLPICFIYLLQESYLKAIYFFLVYLIINLVRSILEPKIMKQQLKIPSFFLLLSMTIHLYLFGIIGLVLSPIHMNLLYCLLDYYRQR